METIWGGDYSKPLSEYIEIVRNQLSTARGQLGEIPKGYKGCGHAFDTIKDVEGLLTCGLIALHNARKEIDKLEKQTG